MMKNYSIQAYVIQRGMSYAGHKIYKVSASSEEHAKNIVRKTAKLHNSVAVIKSINIEA